jgi:hypothetical protein
MSEWKEFSTTMVKDLLFSSRKTRDDAFESLLNHLTPRATDESINGAQALILKHYDHWSDPTAVTLATSILTKSLELKPDSAKLVINALLKITGGHKSVALQDLGVLMKFVNVIVYELSSDPLFDDLINDIITTQLQILDCIYSQKVEEDTKHKERIRTAIVKSTTFGVSKLSDAQVSQYITLISSSKGSIEPVLSLSGILSSRELSQDDQKKIVEYYTKTVLASKVLISNLSSFSPFLLNFVNSNVLDKVIVPSLEKAIIRSSELSLVISSELFEPMTQSLDLPQTIIKSKLLAQLISALKGSKENVRALALKNFTTVLKSKSSDETLLKIADELLKVVKTVSAPDIKVLFFRALSSIPASSVVSTKILSGLIPFVSKDQNELSLDAVLNAFFAHLIGALQAGEVSKETKIAVTNGLKDAKPQLKRAWYSNFGACFEGAELNEALTKFAVEVFPTMLAASDEVIANPTANLKAIVVPYVTLVVAHIIKTSVDAYSLFVKALKNDDKPSILINARVYTKLSTSSEQLWFVKALESSVEYITEKNTQFGSAFITFALSKSSSPEVMRFNIKALSAAYLLNQKVVGDSLISSIDKILLMKTATSDSTVEFVYPRLSTILSALFAQEKQAIHEDTLISHLSDVIISAHNKNLSQSSSTWISLVLSANVDPGYVAKIYHTQVIEKIADVLVHATEQTHDSGVFNAASEAASTMAFIDPSAVGPLLNVLFEKDLSSDFLKTLTSQDIEIFIASEGELVINVLDTRKKAVDDKNSKDYATRKWEESVRKDIANKNQSTKKYTKEEQVLVDTQLAKESEIRKSVGSIYNQIRRSIAIIVALSNVEDFIDNGKSHWVSAAGNGLLDILENSVTQDLIGPVATEAFLSLSNVISSRLGPLKYFVGVATLRIRGIGLLDNRFRHEDVLDLISRLLFRIKFMSVQQPFDFITMIYTLPLLSKVLEQGKAVAMKNSTKPVGKSEFVEEDKEEEQLMLVLEIISTHAELFKNPAIPRKQIVKVLLSLLALPSKAKLAKECLLTLCHYISIDFSDSDLKILFGGLLSRETFVRSTILEALDQEFDLSELKYSDEIWIACHDNEESNAEIALTTWEENGFVISSDSIRSLYPFLDNADGGLRLSVAKAIAHAVKITASENDAFTQVLEELLELYTERARPPEPVLDHFGLVIKSSQDQRDPWEARSGIAITLKFLAPLFNDKELVAMFVQFLIEQKALGDKELIVAEELKEAAIAVIDSHGAENVETLIPVFEAALADSKNTGKTEETIRENVVVLYGSLAKHLQSSDPRVSTIVDRLLKTLVTPSEKVQRAIAEVISPLVPLFKNQVGAYIQTLFDELFKAQTLPRRRGLSYGIAGLAKGYGIASLSEFDIMRNLSDAAEDKKEQKRRESASIVFECLSRCLAKFFEPYVIETLPIILKSLGDAVPDVRDATAEASKVIMQNTTSYGVKKLIPLAIENLDDISWRSKKGSVELLGSMAYLDPTQLSASLSTIVPEIVGVLNDSHKEVRKAADQALKRFGEVIRNPEIQALVPTLIQAIGDPAKHTDEALDALIQTQFVHYIDGPSLALIIHVIHRGMRDRSANTKRKACQIVGNMAILVDTRDLLQYLHQLVSELEIAMVDPVPNTRATAARALGALVEKLGEEQFPELIPRLLDTLYDESKAGDRLGSAQALAEVVSGIGLRKLDEILPTILSGATSSRASVREGFLPLLLFLPVCFGSQFAPYISQIIPAILNGLADTDESIRGTALKAGRLLVKNYASKAVDLLLPELESGLLDVNYRIRLSSVELTGDLLFQITGISGKMELTEEDKEQSGTVTKQLIEALGSERRDRVLSLLFICRSDTAMVVRNAAIDIWKALVANTPRTIKEILPSLTNIIIRRLANPDESQRGIAAQTLGELVRRVGGNAMSQLLPTLQDSLESSDSDAKGGICVAIRELIESSSDDTLNEHESIFVHIIRSTLVDSSPSVREAAATAFDNYQDRVGKAAVDKIIPYLLNMLQTPDSENALAALQEIMTTKSEVIFPILIPTLLEAPIDSFRARALGSFAEVAGKALYKRLSTVINALVEELIRPDLDSDTETELKTSFDKVVLSVSDDEGLHPLLQQLMSIVKGDDFKKRAVIYERMGPFFNETKLDYSIYTQDIVTQCIMSLDDKEPAVVKADVVALTGLVKHQSKETLERLVKPSKQALQITGISGEDLYGFTLPKGANCVLPIFLHGLMYGSTDQREAAALAIADVISKTPATNLKPLVTVITGPLIRVIGERFPSDIKAAILYALDMIFEKIPQFLRPFIPQLQRTFVKSLSDASNETLRLRAAKALGTLIEYQPRVDPLVSELVLGTKTAESIGVKTAMLKALLEVIAKAGEKLSQGSKTSILELVESEILEADDKLAVAYARLVGSLSRILKPDEATQILKTKVLETSFEGDDSSKFAILTLNAFLKDAPNHIFDSGLLTQIVNVLVAGSNATSSYISDNATIAIGKLLLLHEEVASPKQKAVSETRFDLSFPLVSELVNQLALTTLKPVSNSLDTRRLSLVVIRTTARLKGDLLKPHWDVLAPSVFSCVRDVIIPIKLAAEKAFLALFTLVDDAEMAEFNKWFADVNAKGQLETVTGTKIQARSIGDYTKRVGARLAAVERERIEAGGDAETVFSDRIEDEGEIWAVGGVDMLKY